MTWCRPAPPRRWGAGVAPTPSPTATPDRRPRVSSSARGARHLTWDEVPSCDPSVFTIDTVPARFAELGDPWAEMDSAVGSLEALLEQATRDEAAGLPDAPWPPHYEKQTGEAPPDAAL